MAGVPAVVSVHGTGSGEAFIEYNAGELGRDTEEVLPNYLFLLITQFYSPLDWRGTAMLP